MDVPVGTQKQIRACIAVTTCLSADSRFEAGAWGEAEAERPVVRAHCRAVVADRRRPAGNESRARLEQNTQGRDSRVVVAIDTRLECSGMARCRCSMGRIDKYDGG